MKIYVAGKFSEKKQIKEYMNELIKLGHSITHDWTSFENEGDNKNKMAQSAVNDINGVIAADCIICIMTDPIYPYKGSFCELGAALATNKEILIINDNINAVCTTNVFYHHPIIKHVKTWDDLLVQLNNIKLIDEYAI